MVREMATHGATHIYDDGLSSPAPISEEKASTFEKSSMNSSTAKAKGYARKSYQSESTALSSSKSSLRNFTKNFARTNDNSRDLSHDASRSFHGKRKKRQSVLMGIAKNNLESLETTKKQLDEEKAELREMTGVKAFVRGESFGYVSALGTLANSV
jgi:hypothetical protein